MIKKLIIDLINGNKIEILDTELCEDEYINDTFYIYEEIIFSEKNINLSFKNGDELFIPRQSIVHARLIKDLDSEEDYDDEDEYYEEEMLNEILFSDEDYADIFEEEDEDFDTTEDKFLDAIEDLEFGDYEDILYDSTLTNDEIEKILFKKDSRSRKDFE